MKWLKLNKRYLSRTNTRKSQTCNINVWGLILGRSLCTMLNGTKNDFKVMFWVLKGLTLCFEKESSSLAYNFLKNIFFSDLRGNECHKSKIMVSKDSASSTTGILLPSLNKFTDRIIRTMDSKHCKIMKHSRGTRKY